MKRMKNSLRYIGILAVMAVGMTSCGKTNNRKLTNDWKVVSYLEESNYSSSGGNYHTTVSMTENEVTHSFHQEPANGQSVSNSQTGSVKAHEFIIKKDGTWSYLQEISFPHNGSGNDNRIEHSGTWSFLKKNKGDDFEKNERIHFNILETKGLETLYAGGVVIYSNSNQQTFLTGENVLVYVVKTSKKDALELELEKDYAHTSDPGTGFHNTTIRKMTLAVK